MSEPPVPEFTIEELLRQAVESKPVDERPVFTMRELADLWGYSSLEAARKQQDELANRKTNPWKFEPTRTKIVNRAGIQTSTVAYIVIPPEDPGDIENTEKTEDTEKNAKES